MQSIIFSICTFLNTNSWRKLQQTAIHKAVCNYLLENVMMNARKNRSGNVSSSMSRKSLKTTAPTWCRFNDWWDSHAVNQLWANVSEGYLNVGEHFFTTSSQRESFGLCGEWRIQSDSAVLCNLSFDLSMISLAKGIRSVWKPEINQQPRTAQFGLLTRKQQQTRIALTAKELIERAKIYRRENSLNLLFASSLRVIKSADDAWIDGGRRSFLFSSATIFYVSSCELLYAKNWFRR